MTATATAPRKTQKNATTREVLTNPFKVGEQITIPSGTVFTSTAPSAKGRQVVKRSHKVTVLETIPARVQPRNSVTGAKFLVRPVRVRAKGSGGYWKDITLTEKIVRLNGKPLTYETISLMPTTTEPATAASSTPAAVEPTKTVEEPKDVSVEPLQPLETADEAATEETDETHETEETSDTDVTNEDNDKEAEETQPAPANFSNVPTYSPADVLFSSTANPGS